MVYRPHIFVSSFFQISLFLRWHPGGLKGCTHLDKYVTYYQPVTLKFQWRWQNCNPLAVEPHLPSRWGVHLIGLVRRQARFNQTQELTWGWLLTTVHKATRAGAWEDILIFLVGLQPWTQQSSLYWAFRLFEETEEASKDWMTCLRINFTRKDFKTPMSGCWALLFLPIIPSKSLGRCFKFILKLPNKNLLSPPLGKWAFTREESINLLGPAAQKIFIFIIQCQLPY